MKNFFPCYNMNSFSDITIEFLKENGIKGVILDIDNTLVHYDIQKPDMNVKKWFENLSRANIKIAIVSNAKQKRVEIFNEGYNFPNIHKAGKPSKKPFIKIANEMNISPSEIAVVGDQIFTDIMGGNRAKMLTILVNPIDKKEMFLIKLKRILEIPIIYLAKKRQNKTNR